MLNSPTLDQRRPPTISQRRKSGLHEKGSRRSRQSCASPDRYQDFIAASLLARMAGSNALSRPTTETFRRRGECRASFSVASLSALPG